MMSAADIRRRLESFEKLRNQQTNKQLTKTEEGLIIHGSSANKVYIPTTTGRLFHNDDNFVRVIMGPYGSGKSTLSIAEMVIRACGMPRWNANRRRSRWGIVRNTSGELSSTTLAT